MHLNVWIYQDRLAGDVPCQSLRSLIVAHKTTKIHQKLLLALSKNMSLSAEFVSAPFSVTFLQVEVSADIAFPNQRYQHCS